MELENKSKKELIALVKTMGADQSEQTAKKILEVDSSKFELSLSQDGLVLDADLHFIKLMADEEQSILNRPFIRYLQPEYIDRFEASLKLCVKKPVFEANNYLIIDAHNQVQVMNLLMYRKPEQDTIQVIGQPCESISQVDLSAQTSWSHSDSPHHSAPKTPSKNSSANWTWDQLTDQFHGSSIFYEIFGQTASQHHFTGAQFYRQIFPQDLDLVKSELKKSSEEQVPFEILFRIWRKDGKMAWVFWLGKFYYTHSGDPILIAGSCSDLTQQIKTEEALQIAKNRYQSMFENAFDGIFLLKGETIVDCNESMVKLLEWPKESIIGKKPINFSGSKKHTNTQLKTYSQ